MAAKTTIDFEATRAELRGELAKVEAKLERASGRIGELVLDCRLGSVPAAELETARTEQARLEADVKELRSALEAIDEREAEALAAEAARQRRADEERLAELVSACGAAGEKVVDLAVKLGAALEEGRQVSREANALGRGLRVGTPITNDWGMRAMQIVKTRIGSAGIFRPGEIEKAEARLAGKEV